MRLTCTIGCLALCFWVAAVAQTAPTTSQAYSATANFAYLSEDGCVQNEVMVFATRTAVASEKGPTHTAEVTYSRYRYDYCTDVDLGMDLGTSMRPVFSGDLNRASLNATINGHTGAGAPVTVSFALVWDGKGGVSRQAARPSRGGAKLISTDNVSRNAVASGTMDEHEITSGMVGARLHTNTTRNSTSR